MKNFTAFVATASLIAGLGLAAPLSADSAKQTITLPKVDPIDLATGWGATAIIGAEVYNIASDEISKREDMIITSTDPLPDAVVSVGGFLGMGTRHLVVAASALVLVGKKLTRHGATKVSLKALASFTVAP